MSEFEILVSAGIFVASFVAGYMNSASGDPLGLGRFSGKILK